MSIFILSVKLWSLFQGAFSLWVSLIKYIQVALRKMGQTVVLYTEIWHNFTTQGKWLIFYSEMKYRRTISKISKRSKTAMTITCSGHAHSHNEGLNLLKVHEVRPYFTDFYFFLTFFLYNSIKIRKN